MLRYIHTQQHRTIGIRIIGKTARFLHIAKSYRHAGVGHSSIHLQRYWRDRGRNTISGCAIARASIRGGYRSTTRKTTDPPVGKEAGDATYGKNEENNHQYSAANLP